jgi:uncharacterized protein (TIGR02266 family)
VSGTDHDDRRTHQRIPVQLVVEYADAGELVADTTVNISIGGTFIITDRNVDIGTEVSLRLSFPGLTAPVEVPGVVRWCQDRGGELRGAGVEFRGLEGERLADIEALIAAIERGDPSIVSRQVNVLLVDDNKHVATLIEQGLTLLAARADQPVSFVFHTACDGPEGLELIGKVAPDLIIMDLQLPELGGLEIIETVRKKGLRTAIVAISALGDAGREPAMDAGADAYVPKPMRLAQLGEAVRAVIENP